MNDEGAPEPPLNEHEDSVFPAERSSPTDYYCRNCDRITIDPTGESGNCPECHGPLAEMSISSVLRETFEIVNFNIRSNRNVNIPEVPSVEISAADVRNALKCPVCLEAFVAEETASRTECGHVFHIQCINHWLEQQQTCPNCRTPVGPTGNTDPF